MKNLRQLLLYTVLSLAALIMLFPFLWMVLNSFNSSANIFSIPPKLLPDKFMRPGMFSNYVRVLREFSFDRYTLNSLIVAGGSAFGQLVTCSLAGFAFAMMRFRGRGLIFGLLLATMMIPVQVTIIPEYLLMLNLGWLDTYAPLIVPSALVGPSVPSCSRSSSRACHLRCLMQGRSMGPGHSPCSPDCICRRVRVSSPPCSS